MDNIFSLWLKYRRFSSFNRNQKDGQRRVEDHVEWHPLLISAVYIDYNATAILNQNSAYFR